MSLRAKSKAQQWTQWFCAGLVALAVYVIVSRILYGSMNWNIVLPRNQRLVLPLVLLFCLFAWETRWDGIRREEGTGKREQGGVKSKGEDEEESKSRVEVEERNLASGAAGPLGGALGDRATPAGQTVDATSSSRQNKDVTSSDRRDGDVASTKERDHHSSTLDFDSSSPCQPQPPSSTDSLSGEELFDKARVMPHQPIPDFNMDTEYLDLLGKSAAKGYSPALAKLGEYAMRRAAWIEAYYWMKQAQRNGMHGLSPMLREIRKNWAADGFPCQSSNVNKIFKEEEGRLGRALLRLDSGREAAKAREFLKAHHPEFCA